jgi:hypothetical protein
MTTRTVTSHVLDIHGAARAGDSVVFRLVTGTYTATEHVPPETVTATIDSSGNISVVLYCPAQYTCTIVEAGALLSLTSSSTAPQYRRSDGHAADAYTFPFTLPDDPTTATTLEALHATSAAMVSPSNPLQTIIDTVVLQSNNLSDLDSAATARTNLSVPSSADLTTEQTARTNADTTLTTAQTDAAAAIPHTGTLTLAQAMTFAAGGVTNVLAYGALGNGTHDDTAAFVAAFAAAGAGGTVIIPKPSAYYKTTAPITILSGMHISGAGQDTLIRNAASDVFALGTGSTLSHLLIENIGLRSDAGGGHIFAQASGIALSTFRNIFAVQANAAKSIWSNAASGAVGTIDCLFEKMDLTHIPAATVPTWHQVDSSGNLSRNEWNNIRWTNAGTLGALWLECTNTSGWGYDNRIRDMNFEICDGGCVTLLSMYNTRMETLAAYDNTTITRSLFTLGKSSASTLRTTKTRLDRIVRRGGTLAGGVYDINLINTETSTTHFEECHGVGGSAFSIQINSATGNTFTGLPPATIAGGSYTDLHLQAGTSGNIPGVIFGAGATYGSDASGRPLIAGALVTAIQSGTTAGRPATPVVCQLYIDLTLSKIIWCSNTSGPVWKDSMGNIV